MHVVIAKEEHEFREYEQWIKEHPLGSLWQSTDWKTLQKNLGREVCLYIGKTHSGNIAASALVGIDRTAFGLSTWEIARGPLLLQSGGDIAKDITLLQTIIEDAKKKRCMALYCSSPDTDTVVYDLLRTTKRLPFTTSDRHVYPEATLLVDLTLSEEEILMQMKPKGRYNIRVAEKHGIEVHMSTNTALFADLSSATASRDGFHAPSATHYRCFLESLPGAFLLLAYHPDHSEPIGGLLGVCFGSTGIYYYGASSYAHRAFMAPYALQWAAMRHCKAQGCSSYDLLGIAPPESDAMHPWKGITSFKEKFGGTARLYAPEQELVLRPFVKKLLDVKRRILG